jgi:hypothetical protein
VNAPFRDSTEAQVAALRDRLEALDLEVQTLARRPAAKSASASRADSFARGVCLAVAANVALWWGLEWACARFDAGVSAVGLCLMTAFAFGGTSVFVVGRGVP